MIALAAVMVVALVGGAVVFGARHQTFFIPSEAMTPTLQVGDRILVDTHADAHDLPRGAVVVFHASPSAAPTGITELVKRVIGLPGESITFRDDHVYVNDALLDEPWLPPGVPTQPVTTPASYPHRCTDTDPCVVPAGELWVMGDNRSNSSDSRYTGPISEDVIVGRVTRIIWPLSHAGSV